MFGLKRQRKRRSVTIQATEGTSRMTYLEGLMTPRPSEGVAGVKNNYPSYEAQVLETYRKYNGEADFGNQQTRAVLDIRTSFVAGEGLSVNAADEKTRDWFTAFALANRMFSSRFFDLVLGGEMSGKALVFLRARPGDQPQVVRVPWTADEPWTVLLRDKWDPESVSGVMIKKGTVMVPLNISNFVFFRLGGDDHHTNKTTTRVGVVLGELENYDRALKDLRLNNYVAARITPDLQTETDEETEAARKTFAGMRWKIGRMRIGTGKFSYITPGTGAAENLKAEMASALKTIAATTGIPVHWIGWADLMNNRATADSLYETINNATIRERAIYADGFKDLIIKAQEVYINSGGTMISRVDDEIDVSIPVVDRSKFLELVKGLSLAFSDKAISMADYRGSLPGVNPMETERQVEVETEAEEPVIKKTVIPPIEESGEEEE